MVLFVVSFAQAEPMGEIVSAETRTGSISVSAEVDTFSFIGSTDQRAIIGMSAPGNLDAHIRLYYGDPVPANEVAHAGDEVYAEVNVVLPGSGLYTIVVKDGGGNDTGNYSLSLLLISGATISDQDQDGGDIIADENKTGTISACADTDAYTFIGEVDERAIIGMSAPGNLDAHIRLYYGDPVPANEVAHAGDEVYAEVNVVLPGSGLYTIVVKDGGGNDTGNYSLCLSQIPEMQYSPSVRILLNQTEFYPGDTLIISAHVVNGPNPTWVEAKLWWRDPEPNSGNHSIKDPHLTIPIEAYADKVVEVLHHTFSGTEEEGEYQAGARFLEPRTGKEISVSIERFILSP
jgi:hypothetical protein